jgi:hypothetical protein
MRSSDLDGATVAIPEPMQIVQRDRGKRPDVVEAAAEHTPLVIHPVEERARAGKNGPGCGVEVLVETPQRQGHGGVEQRGDLGDDERADDTANHERSLRWPNHTRAAL